MVVYTLPGTTNWGSLFSGFTHTVWDTHMLYDATFGIRSNRFGFTIAGSANLIYLVQSCTNLAHGGWSFATSNKLTSGSCYFSDAQTNHPGGCFYRITMP